MNVVMGARGCNRIRPLLDSYISNELLVETNVEVLRHLEECGECAAFVDRRLEARELLRRSALAVTVPPEFETSLRERIHGVVPLASPRRTNWRMFSAIAAGIVLIAVAGLSTMGGDAGLRAGWSNHMHCTLAGHYPDQPPAEDTMLEKLGPEYAGLLEVVRGQMEDYRIRQAHRCTTEGRRFAHLVLQKDTILMSLSVAPSGGVENLAGRRGMRTTVLQGVEVAAFDAGQYAVFVSSNQGRAENTRTAWRLAPGIREALKTRSARSGGAGPVFP